MHRSLALFLLLTPFFIASDLQADEVADRFTQVREKILEVRDQAPGTPEDEGRRLHDCMDLDFQYQTIDFPEFAVALGLSADRDRWADNSLLADERRDKDRRLFGEALRSIDREKLSDEDRLNLDLLLREVDLDLDGERFPSEYLVLNQLGGVHQDVSYALGMRSATNLDDYEDLLALLRGVDDLIENEKERLRRGLVADVTPPRVTLTNVPQQVLDVIGEEPLKSPMLQHFVEISENIETEEAKRLQAEALKIFKEEIRPALKTYHQFLVDEYVPGSRETIAVQDLPDGEAWYAHLVRRMTTTDLAPQEIHEIGLAEVARIRAEMEKVIERTGFEGDFAAFLEFLRTDPQFFYTEEEDLLAGYRDISKRADGELPKLFGVLPRNPYGVKPIPEYGQATSTTAFYQPGSLTAGRSGTFYANTYKLDSRPKWEMEALTLHEAMPGHHLQISLAQEMEDLPFFRRNLYYAAYGEGWGLYAESLGIEMGFYTDPYSEFGRLTYEMWRAVRLVVDTGMHSFGWSRERAIEYFKANSSKSEHDIKVEIDRYIVTPGQALAYKIGQLKIQELRRISRESLGENFDVRAFLDAVLGSGSLPLDVLEQRIHAWIEEQKEAASPGAK